MGIVLNESAIFFANDNALERNQQEQKYYNYICKHIALVSKAFYMYFEPLYQKNHISDLFSDDQLFRAMDAVKMRLDKHDASKFSEYEFDGYRQKWNQTVAEKAANDEQQKEMEQNYQDAWKHHYENNPHHPEHWVDHKTGVIRDMSLDAIVEMLCDWEAMSMYHQSSILDWYKNDATDEKKAMTDKTKQIVEELLDIIESKQ